jgi:hypothetical protein
MVQEGMVFTRISTDWFRAVLGGMLLAAVLLNTICDNAHCAAANFSKIAMDPIIKLEENLQAVRQGQCARGYLVPAFSW